MFAALALALKAHAKYIHIIHTEPENIERIAKQSDEDDTHNHMYLTAKLTSPPETTVIIGYVNLISLTSIKADRLHVDKRKPESWPRNQIYANINTSDLTTVASVVASANGKIAKLIDPHADLTPAKYVLSTDASVEQKVTHRAPDHVKEEYFNEIFRTRKRPPGPNRTITSHPHN